jgi:hypothetical protein
MDKIFELLGIEKLDESKQEDLKTALQTVVESKASELAESKVETMLEEKEETLKEEYEQKFNEYKDDITTKFSNFVDSVLDEEMVIPENIKKFAHLGEAYEELIEQFKVKLAIDEDMIDEETKSMLKEAKQEIEDLRERVDEMKGKNLDLEKDSAKMAAHIYIRQKCDGLTEAQKKHVINLLDGIIVKEDIDKKFEIIIESLNIKLDEKGCKTNEEEEEEKDEEKGTVNAECPECGNKETVKEGGDMTCPECGAKMKAVQEEEKEEEGKGSAEAMEEEKEEKIEENKSPTNTWSEIWVDMIKNGK